VIVVDELGFHQATSAAELLADRGCLVEVITNGMVVGQDLGVTLDLETWNVKAHAKGIRQRTDVVVLGCREEDGRLVLSVQHHPTGTALELVCDWAACAVPAQPEDALWQELRDGAGGGAPFELHRVGDCLAPRRAHAAVIEGERVGAAL
jgi:2,4-dienoyl-CoA reductase (NADPH2)